MLTAAREANDALAVGIVLRFFLALEALKVIFDRKRLEEPPHFSLQKGGKFAWGAASDSFFERDMTSGRVFCDLGVYVIDALLWWMSEPLRFSHQDDALGGVRFGTNQFLRPVLRTDA